MGAAQNADSRREWANAVLEALRSQSKLPGQASLPPPSPQQPSAADAGSGGGGGTSAVAGPSGSSSGGRPPTGLSGSFAHLFPPQPPANGAKGGGHQSSIYQSPFASHPRSNPALPGGSKGGASAMPPLPSPSGRADSHGPQVGSLTHWLPQATCKP